MSAGSPKPPWSTATEIAIGEALLTAAGRAMTAREIASASDRDPSNVLTAAKAMVEARMLSRAAPPKQASRRGCPTKWAFILAPDQEEALERALKAAPPSDSQRSQQLVFAEATGARLPELLDILANAEQLAHAKWSALCDGERQEYVIAFDDRSRQPVLDLMAILAAAEIRHRRTSLSQLGPARDLARRARRATVAARQRHSGNGDQRPEAT